MLFTDAGFLEARIRTNIIVIAINAKTAVVAMAKYIHNNSFLYALEKYRPE